MSYKRLCSLRKSLGFGHLPEIILPQAPVKEGLKETPVRVGLKGPPVRGKKNKGLKPLLTKLAFQSTRRKHPLEVNYGKSILTGQPFRGIEKNGLEVLQKSLGLLPDSRDPNETLFISIDFEYIDIPSTRTFVKEVGVSMLHTQPTNPYISSQHYRAIKKMPTKYLFGTSVHAKQNEHVDFLKQLLFPENKTRIILVAHGVNAECHILRSMGLNVAFASRIEHVFDTYQLGFQVLGQSFSLGGLVEKLGISQRLAIQKSHFHNAGNDANLTLRAMLLLATHNLNAKEPLLQSRMQKYNKVARSNLPSIL